MSRTKNNAKATKAVARRAWLRARQTAKDAKPLAGDTTAATGRGLRKAKAWARPQVQRTGQVLQDTVAPAASRGVRKARAWAAPQVERTGQVLQDTVAPKVAAALAESARRLDPEKPKRGRWRKLVGISALAAAAAAIAAALRNRAATSAATATGTDEPMPAEPAQPVGNGAAKKPARTS
jgi:hypothetical protein